MHDESSQFSASEPALGYLYQLRYALLQTLRLPEETTCFIEKDDDVDFTDPDEGRILASLKHKAPGDNLTDLSPDFWKSVRIWLAYYLRQERTSSSVSFFLVTTGKVTAGSFLANFLPSASREDVAAAKVTAVLDQSQSKTIQKTKDLLNQLPKEKWPDFFRRITIFDNQERIQEIPQLIMNERLRTVRPQFRQAVYQRLEGWWMNECIELLTGRRSKALHGLELSEMLSSIADQFREDCLPIDYEKAEPENGVDPAADDRYFVRQLRVIGLQSDRVKRAILDYYRSFEQRGSWLRENVTLTGELERYDDRLVEEWARIREILFENLEMNCAEAVLQGAGRDLLNKLSMSDHPNLRIRAGVTATYVTMGSYHILANDGTPRVYWHPRFMERITQILHGRPS